MTTIHLTSEQEATLRPYKGADKRHLSEYEEFYVDLAAQLPDPYVPKPGERVLAQRIRDDAYSTYHEGEVVAEVYPDAVYTYDDRGGVSYQRYRYLRSEHTFRKVEEEQ